MRHLVLPLTAALVLTAAAAATAAPRWSDGNLASEIQNVNCPSLIFGSPYAETEVGAFVGQYVDDGSPVVGEVFDVRLVVAVLGNECAGTRPKLELALPPGVRPAVGAAHTIRCWLRSDSSQPFGPVSVAEGCPTTLSPGTTSHPAISGWLSLDPGPGTPAAPAWPLPQGAQLEIQVPVVADRALNGIGDTTGCVCAVASVQTVNGISRPDDAFTWASSSPSAGAYVHLFAFPAPSGGATGSGPAGPTTPGPVTAAPGAAAITRAPAATGPALKLTKRITRAALRRGRLRARLSGLRRGDRVRVQVRRGRTTVAHGRATAKASTVTVRVRAARGKAARRALRRKARLRVVVTVTRAGKRVTTLRSTLRLT